MMHRVALLLTCVCAVYTQSLHHHIKAPAPPGSFFSELKESNYQPRPQAPRSAHDLNEHQSRQSLVDLWQSAESGEIEEREPVGQKPDSDAVATLQRPPSPWLPEPYNKSLQSLDKTLATLKVHFTPDAFIDKDDKKFRYIVLIHVVNSLSKEVARNGWKSYNIDYQNLIKKYMNEAIINPRNVVFLLECAILHPLERAIRRVREVIHHPAVQFVCTAQPPSCDAAIWAILQTASPETKRSSEVLLVAGNAASTYLNTFASAFEAISGLNVYKYLISAKEEMRPLVAVDAYARQVINPKGEPHCTTLPSPSASSYPIQE